MRQRLPLRFDAMACRTASLALDLLRAPNQKDANERNHDLSETPVEVSAVMPCLNEERTLAICIRKAQQAMRDMGVTGEVVVADNGSKDNSVQIARSLGARVVVQPVAATARPSWPASPLLRDAMLSWRMRTTRTTGSPSRNS